MAANSWKRLSLAGEETSMANALPRTKANFDFSGTTWANDAAVAANPLAGVGAANSTPNEWAFSAAAISELDGKCTFLGGGHTNSGDGSIYTFDTQAAAANINGSGSGIAWALIQPSAQYLDAFTNTRPSAGASPVGHVQTAPSTSTGANQNYWTMPNKSGAAMPVCTHTYHLSKYLPGTRKVIFSGRGGFDTNAATQTNACMLFDDSTGSMTGPLTATSLDINGVTSYGYAQVANGGGDPGAVAVNDVDGLPYTFGNDFGAVLFKWTSPTNSSLALVYTGAQDGAHNMPGFNDAIIIPDPNNSAQRIMFQHLSPDTGTQTDANFCVVTGLNSGGTPVFHEQTYSGSTPTTAGSLLLHYAYDASRGIIWMTDGANLYKITPNTSLTGWTISAAIASSTGDTPPASTSDKLASLQYVPSEDCLIHVYQAGVRVYKPTGWSPPAGTGSLKRNSNLDGLGAAGGFFSDPLAA